MTGVRFGITSEKMWLSSTDPAAMLDSGKVHNISDRKLRLFAAAIARLKPDYRMGNIAWLESIRIAEAVADGAPIPEDRPKTGIGNDLGPTCAEAIVAVRTLLSYTSVFSRLEADFLRDIGGNPFRLVTLPTNPDCSACHGSGTFTVGNGEDAERMRCRCCPWLTPTVVSLAQAAYDQRQRKCDECHGTGNGYHVRDKHISSPPEEFCPPCRGTGTVDDGTLDPVRLAILADALEEAGCDCETLLQHLRGLTLCNTCKGRGWYFDDHGSGFGSNQTCIDCGGGWNSTREWVGTGLVKSKLSHVRGCWALDLILGRK